MRYKSARIMGISVSPLLALALGAVGQLSAAPVPATTLHLPPMTPIAGASMFAIPYEFEDTFSTPTLDPAWMVVPGYGDYSLLERPGYLRYRVKSPSWPTPRLQIVRQSAGEQWEFIARVTYDMTGSGGGRQIYLVFSFGSIPPACWGDPNGIDLGRGRDVWNNADPPGDVSFSFHDNSSSTGYLLSAHNVIDTYQWRVRRLGRQLTVELLDQDQNLIQKASHTYGSQIDDLPQYFLISGNSFSNNESLADIDFVRLKPIDTTPPRIASVVATPSVLWPPNHQMVPVSTTVAVTDDYDPAPACGIVAVTSNEPVNGLGDGDTAPDWAISGNLKVDLRAERSGTGAGRSYTLSIRCTDLSGNEATASTVVTVPHSRKPN